MREENNFKLRLFSPKAGSIKLKPATASIHNLQPNSPAIKVTSIKFKSGFGNRLFSGVSKKNTENESPKNRQNTNFGINDPLSAHKSPFLRQIHENNSKNSHLSIKENRKYSLVSLEKISNDRNQSAHSKKTTIFRSPAFYSHIPLKEKIELQRKASAHKISLLTSHLKNESCFSQKMKQNYLQIVQRLEEIKIKGMQEILNVENNAKLSPEVTIKLKDGIFFLNSRASKISPIDKIENYKTKMMKIYDKVNDPKVWRRV
jgi:hypothetical protein